MTVELVGTVLGGWGLAAWWLDRRGQQAPPLARYDAIVVAGCRVLPSGRPSAALARRVQLAVRLYEAGLAPRLVLTGGKGPDEPVSEAAAAATLCVELGVPRHVLVLEDQSRNTLENAAFAARLVSGEVLVVSDCYHAFRCARMFGRHFTLAHAVGARPAPADRPRLALREAVIVLGHALAGNL